MNRVKLVKAFVSTVLIAGLWVISVNVYLFNRQEAIPNVTSQLQLGPPAVRNFNFRRHKC